MDPLIVGKLTEQYIRQTIRKEDGILAELRDYAIKHGVPIIYPEVKKLLEILLSLTEKQDLLEIGTAIGYSSIFFSKFIQGKITTIEVESEMVLLARENIKKAGLTEKIDVILGDALEVLPCLEKRFDLIFLDGPKAKYIEMLPNCLRLLNPGGLLITDNVFYRGFVATDDQRIPQKRRALVRNLRDYIDEICTSKELETSIIPIGDGVALTIMRERNE